MSKSVRSASGRDTCASGTQVKSVTPLPSARTFPLSAPGMPGCPHRLGRDGLRTRRAEAARRERLHFEQPSPPQQFPATQATRRAAPPNDAPPPPRLPRPRTPLPMGGRRGRAARAASAAEAAAGAGQGLVRVRYRRGRRGPRRQSCAHRREDGPRGSQGPRRPSRRDSSLTRHGPKSALWEKRNTCLS